MNVPGLTNQRKVVLGSVKITFHRKDKWKSKNIIGVSQKDSQKYQWISYMVDAVTPARPRKKT